MNQIAFTHERKKIYKMKAYKSVKARMLVIDDALRWVMKFLPTFLNAKKKLAALGNSKMS